SRVSTDIQNAQQIATAISAEFADAARTTEVEKQTITDGTAKWDGDTAEDSKSRTQKDVLGGVPKSKVHSDKNFSYKVDKEGGVTVYIDDTELYPSQPTTGDWAQN
ncbi:MAG: hypothetical protein PUB25_07590, partial [Lachnospiraceae bacterium]|nr:hypothetical protein [Lachnospiraceae bacterium]